MSVHSIHPDTHTHGLADDCERCAEHAADPFSGLDAENLQKLVMRTQMWMVNREYSRSMNEHAAMVNVEKAIRQARRLSIMGVDFTPTYGVADEIEVEGDEDGWHLKVSTAEGHRYDFNCHSVAWAFAEVVDGTIGAERRFAESCKGTGPPRLSEEDLDAYPLGDPKRITMQREIDRQRGQ